MLSGRDFSHLAAAKKSSLILAPSTLVKSAAPFMDIDTIPLGVNFVKVLEGWVEQCEVLLVLMGSFARLASSQSRRRAAECRDERAPPHQLSPCGQPWSRSYSLSPWAVAGERCRCCVRRATAPSPRA